MHLKWEHQRLFSRFLSNHTSRKAPQTGMPIKGVTMQAGATSLKMHRQRKSAPKGAFGFRSGKIRSCA